MRLTYALGLRLVRLDMKKRQKTYALGLRTDAPQIVGGIFTPP